MPAASPSKGASIKLNSEARRDVGSGAAPVLPVAANLADIAGQGAVLQSATATRHHMKAGLDESA